VQQAPGFNDRLLSFLEAAEQRRPSRAEP
jgi:hypothetical protein